MNWIILRKNRTLYIILAVLLVLFLLAIQGMDTQDWVITVLRGLAVGSITFLVASGFSLIFGLMDVLNLAHGTLFMVGAYVGWMVMVRPDTFIDLSTPAGLIGAGIAFAPIWTHLLRKRRLSHYWFWGGLVLGLLLLYWGLGRYPITIWNPAVFTESPATYAFIASQENWTLPAARPFTENPYPVLLLILLGSLAGGWAIAGLARQGLRGERADRVDLSPAARQFPRTAAIAGGLFLAYGLGSFFFHGAFTNGLMAIGSTWLFFLAIVVAVGTGFGLGALMESSLIRPLYSRPLYQILMTLGVSAVGIELVRALWGRPEFTMPKPAIFNGSGDGCPATSLSALLAHQCGTLELFGGRVIRTYNELFVPLLGMVVLVAIWLLLQRTRIGMIIRAGVQDSTMVEALGINVRRVFTMVFALGVGLAALGGVTAAPSMGLSLSMGESLLIKALIALAIGGLTSFPGAAAGSLLVGLIEQFIIKYGQIGIHIPFMAEPFKPTPPLVPASTVLLMVIVLLAMPNGLFGRRE